MSREMRSDEGADSDARPSAATIARQLGVSEATVSYALNGKPGVSESTRRKVLKLANEYGLRPRTAGADPALSRVIALLVPNLTNPMFTHWAQEILTVASTEGYEVLVVPTDDDPHRLVAAARMLVGRSIDGAILLAARRRETEALTILREARLPFTYLSRRSDLVFADFVGVDDYAAAGELARHVLEHRPSRPATVIGPRFSTASGQREEGFIDAFAHAGIQIPGERRIATDLSREGGRKAAEHLLALRERPDAVLCGSDEISIGILEVLAGEGLTAGKNLIVTGFDGLDHATSPLIGLTTVVQPRRQMALEACRQLFDRLRSSSGHEHRTAIVPHTLSIGRSCGCPPQNGRTA
jgi:LacI family transcriptional regulator